MASCSAGVTVLGKSSHAIHARTLSLIRQPQDPINQVNMGILKYEGVTLSRLGGDGAVPLSCTAARLADHGMGLPED